MDFGYKSVRIGWSRVLTPQRGATKGDVPWLLTQGGLAMKRKTILALLFVCVAAAAAFFSPTRRQHVQAQPQAQRGCMDFRAMYHATLAVNLNTGEGGWIVDPDPVVALLNGEALAPTSEFLGDGTSFQSGKAGHDVGGTTIWHLGNGNDFTVQAGHAIYPNPPADTWGGGTAGQYMYSSNGKIVGGSGQFVNATGTYSQSGPYIFWLDLASDPPMARGKWQALIVASVCTP